MAKEDTISNLCAFYSVRNANVIFSNRMLLICTARRCVFVGCFCFVNAMECLLEWNVQKESVGGSSWCERERVSMGYVACFHSQLMRKGKYEHEDNKKRQYFV